MKTFYYQIYAGNYPFEKYTIKAKYYEVVNDRLYFFDEDEDCIASYPNQIIGIILTVY